jgi:hypothetical protein
MADSRQQEADRRHQRAKEYLDELFKVCKVFCLLMHPIATLFE